MKPNGLPTFDEFINEKRIEGVRNRIPLNETVKQQYVLYSDEYIKADDGSGNSLWAMLDRMILLICKGELKPINMDKYTYTIQTSEENYYKLLSFSKDYKKYRNDYDDKAF
jgi:hypothetical protein